MFDRVTKKYATGVRMIPGYQNGDKPYGILDGATVLTFQGYTTSNMAAHDIAVIKSSGVGLAQIYGLYGMSAYNVANCSNQAKWYTEPHYSPQVNNNEAQAGADGPIVACVQGMVATTLPLLPGSSGSAIANPPRNLGGLNHGKIFVRHDSRSRFILKMPVLLNQVSS